MDSATAVTINGHTILVPAACSHRLDFWRKVARGDWEPPTLSFLQRAVDRTTLVVDIGAWVGPITCVAGRVARRVIALEPVAAFADELQATVAANELPVEIWRAAISPARGSLTLFQNPGTTPSALNYNDASGTRVDAITFDDINAAVGDHAGRVFVKMDIEGFEFELCEALVAFLKARRAWALVALHPGLLYQELRKTRGPLGARRAVLRATQAAIACLRQAGTLRVSQRGGRPTWLRLMSFTYLRRRPKNFTVEVIPST